ncbi:hypothetical protein PL8927_760108 [Planktothrix serta PCC 8927]|uniref:Uncharacterized protein n=1 Tax=Planktothrix serta PCC 8927 TaxID=671068 RepID=A0A7Z9E2Q9_9CYAN|nr:hypothetical protein PL8927_760108 [Planktothrix serta PCC 8927]
MNLKIQTFTVIKNKTFNLIKVECYTISSFFNLKMDQKYGPIIS